MSIDISGVGGSAAPHVMSGASAGMPPQQKMASLFNQIDSSGSGSISQAQFDQAFQTLNPPGVFRQQGADAIFGALDPNGTGSVSKQDFVSGMSQLMASLSADNGPAALPDPRHFNYTFNGRKEPDFPGGFASNHALNATPEFGYGVTDWFEFGFYIPWAVDGDGRFLSNAAKVRTLFVLPNSDKKDFFYGINFEFDFPTKQFAQTRFALEIRPIIGWCYRRRESAHRRRSLRW
jgi:EF-hand domain pair